MKNNENLKLSHIEKNPVVANDDIFDNMLVHGDNLLALRALEHDFTGRIKCVYIDPPYNTGETFKHYDDNAKHSLWLRFMRNRLEIMWRLLTQDGSLWISIDDREVAYLRVLLDEICGRNSFVACNVWQKRYSRENRAAIGDSHEYVLVYAKDSHQFKDSRNKLPLGPKQLKTYKNKNNDPRGKWCTVSLSAQSGHATSKQFYEIISPGGKKHHPPPGRCWGLSESTYEELLIKGRIYFGKDGNAVPRRIQFLSEISGLTPWAWWPHEEVGHTHESKNESQLLFGKSETFDTPKPERLIQRILHIATNAGDLVLDAFAGSGTTAAVAHKMGRKWIAIEIGDHAQTHCIPRLKKVISGEDEGGISKDVSWVGGGGFYFYEVNRLQT